MCGILLSLPTGLIIQYTIVGAILVAAVVWVIYKAFTRKGRAKGGSCCGCALSEHCGDAAKGKTKVASDGNESDLPSRNCMH